MFGRNKETSLSPALPPSMPVGQHSMQEINEAVQQSSDWVDPFRNEIAKNIVGQEHLVKQLLVGVLTGGHILLEGLPGLAKTLAVKSVSNLIQADFKRIQFTPDMLPADILGTQIYNPQNTQFEIKQGPIFSSIVLADEINRAPAKVQSALLEAMQEKQVTIGDTTFRLPELFLVLATQNPIEQEGTYPLPEAQVDRFMLKVVVDYPTKEQERMILDMANLDGDQSSDTQTAILSPEEVFKARKVVHSIYMDDKIKDYIVSLIHATRDPSLYNINISDYIDTGASPRATLSLKSVAKSLAYLAGRGYVTPDDVKSGALDVMRHRIRLSYEAEAESISSEDIIRIILDSVPIP